MSKQRAFPAIVGFDGGNSTAILSSVAGHTLIDSWIGAGRLDDLLVTRSGFGSASLAPDEHVVEWDGRSYFVGELARRECADATNACGENRRYFSEHNIILLLALVGAHFKAPETPELHIVTGVPISVSRELEGVKEKIATGLIGDYSFIYNGQPRRCKVVAVKVLMEGMGAILAYGKSGATQGVVDIGGRTTDIAWIENNRPVLQRCDSIALGVEIVGDRISAAFHLQYKRNLSAKELNGALHTYAHDEIPMITHRGECINLGPMIASAIKRASGQIATFLGQNWTTGDDGMVAADAAQIIIVGGGAYYFNGALTKTIDAPVVVPAEPELGNARGYLKMALRIDERNAWGG